MPRRMDDSDFNEMVRLIKRFGNEELDQWAMWRIPTDPYGSLYVSITRGPLPDSTDEHYDVVEVAD